MVECISAKKNLSYIDPFDNCVVYKELLQKLSQPMQESRGTRGWKVDTRICNEITLGSSEIRFGSDSGNSVHCTVQCNIS